jgi:hypothetical protein
MPRSPDDDRAVAGAAQSGASNTRVLVLGGGFALAVAATLAVFLTDNPQYLRIAVVAVAWAFVIATFAAGRRTGDRAESQMRESELRHAYEMELEREIAARREYELALENELRRETEDSMRGELDALRGDIAKLSGLREEVARVSALGGDIAKLTDLRDQVARVAAMRDDVAALSNLRNDVAALGALRDDVAGLASLRQELGQLADLRADMGRLRAELTEQLSSEMLVERIVMRTQASRLPGDPGRGESGAGRALEGTSGWADDMPPRELTGGWPAIRLDEPRETQQFEQVRVDRTPPRPPMPTPIPTPEPDWQTPSWEPPVRENRPSSEPVWESPAWERPSWEKPSWETPSWETAPEPEPREAPRTGWTSAPLPPLATPPSPMTEVFPAAPLPPGAASPLPAPHSADRWSPSVEPDLSPRRSRHSVDEPTPSPAAPVPPPTAAFPMVAPPVPSEPAPSPMDWLASRSLLDAPAPPSRPDPAPRRRRHDEPTAVPVPNEYAPTTQHPAVNGRPSPTPRPTPPPSAPTTSPSTVARPEFDRSAFRFATPEPAPTTEAPGPDLNRLLADNGSGPSTGSRRRRRYRDDDDSDDVLARVLRGE